MPKVEFVAEYVGQNLDKGLKNLNKDLAITATQAVKTSKAIEGTAPALAKAAVAANRLDSSLQKGTKGSAQATNALLNLGRVAQDAPFGIIGIANNINPLLESFQRLQAETGKTSLTLKALAGSLLGGGGLGLAISIATSLLTAFAMNSRSAGDETKKTKEKVDEAAEAQKKFESDIRAASQAILGQAKNLKDLRRLLVDTSATYNDLTAATKRQAFAQYLFGQRNEEVQKILDAVIKQQLRQAKINNPFAGNGVREYSQDLFAVSRYMEAVKNRTIEFSKAGLEAAKNAQAIAESTADLANLNVLGKGFDDIFASLVDGSEKAAKSAKEIRTVQDVLNDLGKEIDFLNRKGLTFNTNEFRSQIDAITGAVEELLRDFKLNPDDTIIAKLIGRIDQIKGILNAPALQKAVSDAASRLQERVGITVPVIPRMPQGAIGKLQEDISAQTQQLAVDVANSFGQAIGEGLATGTQFLSNALGGIMDIIGDYLIQLGKASIAASLVIKAIKAANPVVGIAAGLAAIIAGNILKNIQLPKFATGGTFNGGGSFIAGERGPEIVTAPRGTVITPNAQTNAILGRGGEPQYLYSVVSGSDILLASDRAALTKIRNGQR